MRRFTQVAIVATGLLFGSSCSKTQDTAPETRLFGSPPEIQNAQISQSSALGQAECDYSRILAGFLCTEIALDQFEQPFPPTITLSVNYSELSFNVEVVDPDSVAGAPSDILLVSASYLKSVGGQPVETSIVILDDGGTNNFNYNQQGIEIQEKCVQTDTGGMCGPFPSNPSVICDSQTYTLTSNDTSSNDGHFTRGFALISNSYNLTAPTGITLGSKSALALNCIARDKQQFPALADVTLGQPVSFKIEAVDRAGNLSTWPAQLQGNFNQTSLACGGDECACCFLLSSNLPVDCRGRQGLRGVPGSGFEAGLCITGFGP